MQQKKRSEPKQKESSGNVKRKSGNTSLPQMKENKQDYLPNNSTLLKRREQRTSPMKNDKHSCRHPHLLPLMIRRCPIMRRRTKFHQRRLKGSAIKRDKSNKPPRETKTLSKNTGFVKYVIRRAPTTFSFHAHVATVHGVQFSSITPQPQRVWQKHRLIKEEELRNFKKNRRFG